MASPPPTPSSTYYTQGHHTLQANVSGLSLPQRGQTCHIPSHFCPCLYFECLETTFADTNVFRRLDNTPESFIHTTIDKLTQPFTKRCAWAIGRGKELPNAYVLPKGKKQFRSGRPIVSFFSAQFRPMLNCIIPTHPSCFPTQLGQRRRVRTHSIAQGRCL